MVSSNHSYIMIIIFCTQLYGFEYSYLMQITFKQVYLSQIGTTTSGWSKFGNNGHEEVTPYSSELWNWRFTIGYSLVSFLRHNSRFYITM